MLRFELHDPNVTALDAVSAPVVDLSGCASLEALPRDLRCVELVIDGCTSLKLDRVPPEVRRLSLVGCAQLRALPAVRVAELNIAGCTGLSTLSNDTQVERSLELAGTTLSGLGRASDATLYWRGVRVPPMVVLAPEHITSARALSERNAELRRVLIERMGYERFVSQAKAQCLDEDRDPGGARALLCVDVPDDEPVVLLSVRCPSTRDRYVLRVPPTVSTCHEAAAWIAGLDPSDYAPVVET